MPALLAEMAKSRSAYSQKYPEATSRGMRNMRPSRSGAPTSAAHVSSICMSARQGRNTSRMMS